MDEFAEVEITTDDGVMYGDVLRSSAIGGQRAVRRSAANVGGCVANVGGPLEVPCGRTEFGTLSVPSGGLGAETIPAKIPLRGTIHASNGSTSTTRFLHVIFPDYP